MVNEIKDIRLYKILLEDIDEKIESIEKSENTLFLAEKELKALNKKHSGLFLVLLILLFSCAFFILFRMAFVIFPSKFPYYFLAPIPGIITELYLRNKFNENEKKYSVKTLNGQIKECKENIDIKNNELSVLIPLVKEAKIKLTKITDIMSDNSYALNYITRNEDEYNKVSFEVRYEEFINKINSINDDTYPELTELKNKVIKENDKIIYRNIVIDKILKDMEVAKEHEKNNNAMSDTEDK